MRLPELDTRRHEALVDDPATTSSARYRGTPTLSNRETKSTARVSSTISWPFLWRQPAQSLSLRLPYQAPHTMLPPLPKNETTRWNENKFQIEDDTSSIETNTEKSEDSDTTIMGILKTKPSKKDGTKNEIFAIKIEPVGLPKRLGVEKNNWISEYIRKPRKERVKWQSKLHRVDKNSWHKLPLHDKVEDLVDLAAKDFSDWLNSLASDKTSRTVTKERIKQLFPVLATGDSLRGLEVDYKDLYVLPEEILEQYRLGKERSLAANVERIRRRDAIENRKAERYIAFGKNLPVPLRQRKREVREVEASKTIFPEDLRTKETLFRGIEHLQSTRLFIEHLKKHPELPKPEYLTKSGAFAASQMHRKFSHVPLRDWLLKTN
ncbi:uncharacterized protein LOC129805190 [Phlebotomus papatasi]|uniref:uncharacterized protein LOC129805190 n=1 Tax=Phlebotomus papatasi TaxID=29031 RepID=UPI002483B6FC|nr:uncharacterized protein LOC129805190 [Phlebotomus papatasi]